MTKARDPGASGRLKCRENKRTLGHLETRKEREPFQGGACADCSGTAGSGARLSEFRGREQVAAQIVAQRATVRWLPAKKGLPRKTKRFGAGPVRNSIPAYSGRTLPGGILRIRRVGTGKRLDQSARSAKEALSRYRGEHPEWSKGRRRRARAQRGNPADAAAAKYEEFHGRPSEKTVTVKREIHYPSTLRRSGNSRNWWWCRAKATKCRLTDLRVRPCAKTKRERSCTLKAGIRRGPESVRN